MRRAVVLAAFALAALGACEKPGASSAPDAAARYTPMDGGKLRACYTEAACDGLRPGDRCYFGQPQSVDPQGFCAPAEPPCVVSYPFCGVDGKTVWACRFPAKPWTRKGPCDEAGAPR